MITPPARFADFFSTAKLDNIFNSTTDTDPVSDTNRETEQLLAQLDKIFGTPKNLNKQEQQQAEVIEHQISKIYEEFDKNFSCGITDKDTDSKTKHAAQLYKKLDKLYGVKIYEELSEQEKQLVDSIETKLWPAADMMIQ